MESYEQFYSRTLNTLLPPDCSTAPQQQRALSDIHFHGRRLLEPVLSEELRVQMAEDRQTAVERDRKRQTDALLQRVQDILNNIHLKKTQNELGSITSDQSLSHGSKTSPIRSIGPFTAPAQSQNLSPSSSLKRETLRLLNQRMEKLLSDESSDGSDPESLDSTLSGLSLSLTGSYAQLPGPQPSRSPLTHRARRPRPHTTGNILISHPVSESELSTNGSEYLSGSAHNEQHLIERSVFTTSSPAPSGAELNCSCSEFSDRQLSIITSTPSSRKETTKLDSTQDVSHEKTRPARRSPPAPLNRSYDVESPSPSLIRPQVVSAPSPGSVGPIRHSQQQDETGVKQQIQALDTMRERLEREHAHQISELLAAQERQTQQLQRKLNEQSRRSMMSSTPELSRKTRHTSHTQDVCVEQMKPLCRLTAVARGFLTRRLLQTEKITHLRKTVQDSRAFIRSFQTDSQQRRASVSHQDLTLQQRVTAQLQAALHNIHQIFFVWPLRDRLRLLQQDREIRRERTLREMEKDSPGNTRTLSSATQKTLDRKAQRQTKTMNVIPKSSAARILRPRLSQNTVCSSQSAVKKRDGCLGVRPRSLQRKCLSLG
ncbi:centriolar coiled-coil protein of 110 kDa isoform X3 [Ctenopharyngodon idella]|uniref:centriolar coiled-coil protein of 110 kDa isoform X3 n=1 Tax=Ctenopharyngodon idella TaxID=7959 RepID=UPI00223086EC|nr:centriolar coiled-coil protein of 110 kDa isoform X3 [Ctenopharyngodon idella]XP_051771030.1 centriolar coiled-coil protein of 110 kDa isoform X3 [Ctenopharyngodon idella]